MNEAEIKRKKSYSRLLSGFRIMMVLFFVYQLIGDFWNEPLTASVFTKLSIFVLYVLGMLLLSLNKVALYIESAAIVGMMLYFNEPMLISLFVFPLAISMVGEVRKVDMFALPLLLLIAIFVAFQWNTISVAFSLGMFVFFYTKERETYIKFQEIKNLRILMTEKDKNIQNLEMESLSKEKENEIVTEMFVKIKNLNEKINIDELVKDLVVSPKSMFHAEYVVAYILEDGRYRFFKEAGQNRRFEVPSSLSIQEAENEEYTNESMSVSLKLEGKLWGALKVYGKKEHIYANGQKIASKFNEDDFEILALYTEQVMFSMGHARMLMKMEELANKDFLTKIPNRRYFMEQFSYLIGRAKRGDELAVMVLDIDHFKKFNDTYGHDKGDEALKVVAEALTDYVREVDFAGRLGGEEFGVLVPNANGEAPIIAERIRRMISIIPFVEPITVSIGITYYGRDGVSLDDLYNKADRALYDAKETGRNKVCEYQER